MLDELRSVAPNASVDLGALQIGHLPMKPQGNQNSYPTAVPGESPQDRLEHCPMVDRAGRVRDGDGHVRARGRH
jgi:hypothetical protein